MNEKEKILKEIKINVGYEEKETFLSKEMEKYLSLEELEEISLKLKNKKIQKNEENFNFLDEIYQKTTKDKI